MDKNTPFQKALLDSTLEDFSHIPGENELSGDFSPQFEKSCKKLLRQSDFPVVYHLSCTVRRAVLIAAILAASVITAFAVPELRENIFSASDKPQYEYSFDPILAVSAPGSVETVYLPAHIPEGFTLERKLIHEKWVTCLWRSDEDTYITFDQYPIPEGAESVLSSEDSPYEIIELDGYEVFRIHSSAIKYYWTDNEYFYTLIFSPNISKQEHKNVFYSITAVPWSV